MNLATHANNQRDRDPVLEVNEIENRSVSRTAAGSRLYPGRRLGLFPLP